MMNMIPNCTLELIEWADHKFNNAGEREQINTLFIDFFQKYLWNQ